MERRSTEKHWQKYWKDPLHQPMVRHEELLANLQAEVDVKGKEVLEVGAGMGGDSIYLAKKGAKVTTLDFTSEALVEIRKLARRQKVSKKTIQADAQSLPFADGIFDIVFHEGFLEHFTQPLPLLTEQVRVLKPGGYLVVDVPQRFTTYTVKKHFLMLQKKWFAGWEREFSVGELERLLKTAGLTIIRTYGWGYYGKLYSLRHLKLGGWYERLWQKLEQSRLKLYLNWCIGVVAQKP